MKKVSLSCGTCLWNDDLLCDKYGKLVKDDDKACKEWELTRTDSDKKVDDNTSISHFSS